jgi:hypothetical protein
VPLVLVQTDWFVVSQAEIVAFAEDLVWFSLLVVCNVSLEADDPIIWSCD